MIESLRDRIIRHEGLRLRPYRDSVGKLTIGVGRNLDDNGITHDEAMLMLDHDLIRAGVHAEATWPWMTRLTPTQQDILVEMTFNMGAGGVSTFKRMLAALEAGQIREAATEMERSLWAVQVGDRAKELVALMRSEATEG